MIWVVLMNSEYWHYSEYSVLSLYLLRSESLSLPYALARSQGPAGERVPATSGLAVRFASSHLPVAGVLPLTGGHPLYLSISWWRAVGKWSERWSVGKAQRCPRSSSLRPKVEPSTYPQLSSAHWWKVSDRHA